MNSTTLTTILGIAQAIGVAVVDFMATTPDDGGSRWTNPVFYLGLGIAVAMAVKGYFTKGTDPAAAPTK